VFIPVAEQSGIVVPIGTWVLRQVCADLRELYPAHGLSVTVNVSARQLRDESFANTVLDLLRADGLPGQALIIEITETVLITSVADALTVTAQLERLRESGVRIAIDDFGTGYSSLSYLRELPVDVLKMDGSFTDRQSQREERDAAFIAAILNLSASLDLPTIAEAVETAEQAQWLAELGCRLGQGYHFARPAPVGALRELLRAQRPSSTALPATP
jgi:EAL domain-containing protein (putative c-di-GMP-specific phosphodiesterase class I)